MSSPGIHAILFVVTVASRFTDEDEKTINAFLQCFGEEGRKHILVIFTRKDDLDKNKTTIDEFVRTCPESLQQFLATVQGRYMAVNNDDKSPDKKTFTQELVKRVLQMVGTNGGKCYTNEMYEKVEIQLKEAEDEKVRKIAAANKASDDERIQKEMAQINEELRMKRRLCEEELARKKEEAEKRYRAQLEDERQKMALRHIRQVEEELRMKQRLCEIQLKEAEDEKARKIAAANKASDDERIQKEMAQINEELRMKRRLCEEELARKKEEAEKTLQGSIGR
ncbi:GTPase IMAP family member 4-like [Haliotis cracherodii]|uniref:GTPase IMAP family member 4-like n=1 Tax=Haliotis cracherodii TaxID=6455 RepID=UPI0039E91FB6